MVRLVAWREADGRETWGLADDGGRVWDGGRHTGAALAAVQAAVCAAPGAAAALRTLGAPAGGDDLAETDLTRDGRTRLLPWRPPEVWAAGVTYKASEDARRRESRHEAIYPSMWPRPSGRRCSSKQPARGCAARAKRWA